MHFHQRVYRFAAFAQFTEFSIISFHLLKELQNHNTPPNDQTYICPTSIIDDESKLSHDNDNITEHHFNYVYMY